MEVAGFGELGAEVASAVAVKEADVVFVEQVERLALVDDLRLARRIELGVGTGDVGLFGGVAIAGDLC